VGDVVVGEDVLVSGDAVGEAVGEVVVVAEVGDIVGAPVLIVVTVATPVLLIVPYEANVEDDAKILLEALNKVASNVAEEPAETINKSKMTVDMTCTLPAEIESITTALVCTLAADATVEIKSKRKDASKVESLNSAMSTSENDTVEETMAYEEKVGAAEGEAVVGDLVGETVV
jgi:hypothetical protein